MPSKVVTELMQRVAKLEARVENLIYHQKWQLGMLGALIVGVLINIIK